jgi:hypothetical protein
VNLTPRYRTVAQLSAPARPNHLPQDDRVVGEFSVYPGTRTVTRVANEDDGEVHIAFRRAGGSDP